jgi:hypothetical protein
MDVLSCFPESDIFTGNLKFPVSLDSFGRFETSAYLIGGLVLFPAIAAIATISQIFLGLNSLNHHRKINKHSIPLPTSHVTLRVIRKKRLEKLKARQAKIPEDVRNMTSSYGEELKDKYQQLQPTNLRESLAKDSLGRRLLKMHELLQNQDESLAYTDIANISLTLEKRHEFAKLRHRIAIEVNMHYMKNLCKILLPGIGLYWLASSKETTKERFMKGSNLELVNKYNQMIRETPWLKRY